MAAFFPSPYAAAVVKLKKMKSKVILNFEKVDITRSLLSYTFGKLYYWFFFLSSLFFFVFFLLYFLLSFAHEHTVYKDTRRLNVDQRSRCTLADLKFIKMEPQLINFGTISNRFDSKINIYAAELSYLVLRMRIAISYSLANCRF
jgi:hypothetical protein